MIYSEIDRSIIEKIGPTFDKLDKFIFFYNYKACSMSIQHHDKGLCKHRIIRQKQHKEVWYKKFEQYTDDDIKNIFKFTIVRNPWSRLASAHRYFLFYVPDLVLVPNEFERFVKETLPRLDKATLMYPAPSQRLEAHVGFQHSRIYMVDCIVKMENIKTEFEQVYEKAEIKGKLPHINKTNVGNYRKYYNRDLKNIVGDFYKKDIELFKYTF
jgi:hypothetical protein